MASVGGERDPFDGFQPSLRRFLVTATEVSVARQWVRKDTLSTDDDKRRSSTLGIVIGGKAQSSDDVTIIGEPKSTKEFFLHINTDNPAEVWADIRRMSGVRDTDDDVVELSPARGLRKRIYEKMDEDPPTAVLFWSGPDAEIGIKEGWVIECTIPEIVRDQFVNDLVAGTAGQIRIAIKWWGGLVLDIHAPPSEPTTWGLFRVENDEDPEPLHGYVESFSWDLQPIVNT